VPVTSSLVSALVCVFCCSASFLGQEAGNTSDSAEPARVYVTDSQSWSIAGQSGGGGGAFGGSMAGGARPQTAEIIKTFGERCPQVKVNNIQEKADYIVLLDHEGGKGALRHKNKVAVFARVSGDSIVSKSTLSLGGSVQDACEAIIRDWATHGAQLRAGALAGAQSKAPPPTNPAAPPAPAATPSTGKVSVSSTPDGADIEVDGSFAGNTPSDLALPEGEHVVSVKKAGFATWQRKLKISSGSSIRLNAELEKAANP